VLTIAAAQPPLLLYAVRAHLTVAAPRLGPHAPYPVLSVWYRADLRMAVANDWHADIR